MRTTSWPLIATSSCIVWPRSVWCCFPFALGNFVRGQTILGCTTFAVVVILALNAAAIHLRRPPLLSPAWLYVPVLGSLLVAISTQGLTGLFWLYPALIFFFFVLDRRQAMQVDLGLILVLTPWAALHLGWELCSRVLATTVLTVLLTTTFLSIIAMLQEQTLVDPLTGAYNRRHLEVCLRSAIERLRRYGTPCSLLALDVDHFKRINDQHGHDAARPGPAGSCWVDDCASSTSSFAPARGLARRHRALRRPARGGGSAPHAGLQLRAGRGAGDRERGGGFAGSL